MIIVYYTNLLNHCLRSLQENDKKGNNKIFLRTYNE